MLKKIISTSLVCVMLLLANLPTIAQIRTQENLQLSKENVSVKNLKDVITQESRRFAEEKTFTDADFKRMEKESLNRQVKRNNLSTTAKVGIGVGIAAAIILVVVLATRGNDSPPLGNVQCGGVRAPCP